MLGRQQIAGIPTAVSEIFKNAYDAYATTVRGDFFPDREILMIRDDGIGMTPQDFRTRWLTIGTESKAVGSNLPALPRPAGIPERRQMGEKGIGRLAIASTGPQMILVSRALATYGQDDDCIVVALMQWSLFEIPGLTLDDVVVPMRTIMSFEELSTELITSMRDELLLAVDDLASRVPTEWIERIRSELGRLDLDVSRYLRVAGPSPTRSPGTAFIVQPVNSDLEAAMQIEDINRDEFSVSPFQRFLLGFINTITPDAQTPKFVTEFIRHDAGGYQDIIDPSTYFWEKQDFSLTDHTIEGSFDEYGRFEGTLLIYGKTPIQIVEPWIGSKGDRSSCGPFNIKFGYVQGKSSESSLAPEDFALMTRRLEKIGGLYVYRDGIRVLPYGNSDNDYLEIEKRRSLNAGKYYFSYRRMFGAIEIDSQRNRGLQEKAGREGFRENKAYRDFRDILKSFLTQLAANFFSSNSESSSEWRLERQRIKDDSLLRKERAENEKRDRERFAHLVNERMNYIESGHFQEDLQRLLAGADRHLTEHDSKGKASLVLEIERDAFKEISDIREKFTLERPLGIALTTEIERDWKSLSTLAVAANASLRDIAASFESRLRSRLSSDEYLSLGDLARHDRVDRIRSLALAVRAEIEALVREVEDRAREVDSEIRNAASMEFKSFEAYLDLAITDDTSLSFATEVRIAEEIKNAAQQHAGVLKRLRDTLSSISASYYEGRELLNLKEQVLDLQEQIDSNLELLQLGQAVQVVSHEFDTSIRSVRAGLQRLAPWAKSTPRLQPIVRDLKASFAHLDGYLRLFTPLQRRLYREVVTISGLEVESFIRGVFDERLTQHDVDLIVTSRFRHWQLRGYPSTFYPVFTNLVDNAIYWVSADASEKRWISLDADDISLCVSDSGPGIRPSDRENVFRRGFGRRRGGRGLGLALARELLDRDGWDLDLVPSSVGAVFRIGPRVNEGQA